MIKPIRIYNLIIIVCLLSSSAKAGLVISNPKKSDTSSPIVPTTVPNKPGGLDPRVKLEGEINSFVTSVLGKKNIFEIPLKDEELKDWDSTLNDVTTYLTSQGANAEPVLWEAFKEVFPAITAAKNVQRSVASFYATNPDNQAERTKFASYGQTLITNLAPIKTKVENALKKVQDYQARTTKGYFVRNRTKKLDAASIIIYFLTAISSILDKMEKDYQAKAKAA